MNSDAIYFVGSMTRGTPYFESAHGIGITACRLEPESGGLVPLATFQGVDNPSFLAVHPAQPVLYAVSEVYGWNEGEVTALSFDPATGAMRYINKQPTRGSITAHVGVDRGNRYLLVTNYSHERWKGFYGEDTPRQAVCVFPLDEDGTIGHAVASVQHDGTGPDPSRQTEPHPHCAIASADNRYVLVADLGMDAVVSYRFDEGRLTRSSVFKARPGDGPRHLKFAPAGNTLYVVNELGSTVYRLAYDADTGTLEPLQSISTLPDGNETWSRCSELIVAADGRFLYAANRGHDSVAVFAVDPTSGALERIAVTPCGGKVPRNIAFGASEDFLFSCNQNSDTITSFRRDPQTGLLTQSAETEIGTPMVIVHQRRG